MKHFFSLVIAFVLLFSSCSDKEVCTEMKEVYDAGITFVDFPFCTDTAYLYADQDFTASYVPLVGNDDVYNYNWIFDTSFHYIQNSGITASSIELNDRDVNAPNDGIYEICLQVESECGDLSETACRTIRIINTPYITTTNVGESGDPEDVVPGPVGQQNFANREIFKYNEKGYVITGGNSGTPTLYEFDPSTEEWVSVMTYSSFTAFDFETLSVSVLNDQAYLFGKRSVFVLDLTSFNIDEQVDYPSGQYGALFSVEMDDEIYVAVSNNTVTTGNGKWYKYDPDSKSFEELTDLMHEGDPGNVAYVVNNKILVGGGSTRNVSQFSGSTQPFYEYDPSDDSWTLSVLGYTLVIILDFEYQDTIYMIDENSNMYYLDEAQYALVQVDLHPDEWPSCWGIYEPDLEIKSTTENWASCIVIGDKLHIADSRVSNQNAASLGTIVKNEGRVFRLKAL
jgi:hypothetical protein